MKQGRFTDEQIVRISPETDLDSVVEVATSAPSSLGAARSGPQDERSQPSGSRGLGPPLAGQGQTIGCAD
jgi:hypothetical protein